jgi:hypothetical protein
MYVCVCVCVCVYIYVLYVGQEFVAAKELYALLCAEQKAKKEKQSSNSHDPSSNSHESYDMFLQRSLDHKDELEQEESDAVNKIISAFL